MATTDATLDAKSTFAVSMTASPGGTASSSTLNPTAVNQSKTVAVSMDFGTTGPLKCDLIVCQERALTPGASEELNLYNGSLSTIIPGTTAPFRNIKFIRIDLIANPGTGVYASGLTVGNAGTDPNQLWFGATSSTQTIDRYVPFVQGSAAGKTVGSGTARVKVLNADGAVALTYRITIAGCST